MNQRVLHGASKSNPHASETASSRRPNCARRSEVCAPRDKLRRSGRLVTHKLGAVVRMREGTRFAPFGSMRPHEHEHPSNEQVRSEARLRDRVHEQLQRHGQLDATKIGIVVRNGQVLLWGSVASEFERNTAGEIAANIAGRQNVINHIHVFRTLG
jgi:hypothetical protein